MAMLQNFNAGALHNMHAREYLPSSYPSTQVHLEHGKGLLQFGQLSLHRRLFALVRGDHSLGMDTIRIGVALK